MDPLQNYPETPLGGGQFWPEVHQPAPPAQLVKPPPAPPRTSYGQSFVQQPRRDPSVARRPANNGQRTLLYEGTNRQAPGQDPRPLYAAPLTSPSLPASWLDPACNC